MILSEEPHQGLQGCPENAGSWRSGICPSRTVSRRSAGVEDVGARRSDGRE